MAANRLKYFLVLWVIGTCSFQLSNDKAYPMLYDDFSGSTIDPSKWNAYDFVREVVNGELFLMQVARGQRVTNNMNIRGAQNIYRLEADVSILDIEDQYTEESYSFPYASVTGLFASDRTGLSPGDLTGQFQIMTRIGKYRGNLEAKCLVWKILDSSGTSSDPVSEHSFSTVVNLGETYRIWVAFDPSESKFSCGIDDQFHSITVDEAQFPPNVQWKAFRTDVRFFGPEGSELSGKVAALFDNVVAKDTLGNPVVTDDFSGSRIDKNKWSTYEFVRSICDGELCTALRSEGETSGISMTINESDKEYFSSVEA